MGPWLLLKAILSSVIERGENCNEPQLGGIRISWRFSREEPLGHHLHFGTHRVSKHRARIPSHHIGNRVGCEAVLKILKKDLAIQVLINNTQGPSNDHFRLAHKLEDHHLMALIAQRDRNPGPMVVISKSSKSDGTGVHKLYDKLAAGLVGSSAGMESPFFELGGFSYDEFLRWPPTILWALARSTYLARIDHGAIDVDVMAQLFEKLLKTACKSVHCWRVLQ